MGKRVIIFICLVLVILAAAFACSAVVFSASYDRMVREQSSAQEEIPQLPTELPSPQPAGAVTNMPDSALAAPYIARMTPEEKICQLLVVRPEALTGEDAVTELSEEFAQSLSRYPVGGLIFFSANLNTARQTQELLAAVSDAAQALTVPGLFFGVDEEGGTVSRASKLGVTAYEDMRVYGDAGDPEAAYEIGLTLGTELKALGFNLDFAPVADVLSNDENTVVQTRSFGTDPALVSDMVSREVAGFLEAGVLCAPKHFPGHGSTAADTHEGLAVSDRTLEELRACDLLPFQSAMASGAPMIMVGHMTMAKLDPDAPASMSKTIVTELLREELGYGGIIITDALDMDAIADLYAAPEAVVQALSAGCDMVLCPEDIPGIISAVKAAVADGKLSQDRLDQSVCRVVAAKIRYGVIA